MTLRPGPHLDRGHGRIGRWFDLAEFMLNVMESVAADLLSDYASAVLDSKHHMAAVPIEHGTYGSSGFPALPGRGFELHLF